MARRNPMNARYQKHTGPAGKTRKSAAAAKPKREAGTVTSAKTSAAASKPKEKRRIFVELSPEAKKWRRLWAVLLGAGFLLAVVSVATQSSAPLVGRVTVIAAYVCIGAGIFVDFKFVRPAIQAARYAGGNPATGGGNGKAQPSEQDKGKTPKQ